MNNRQLSPHFSLLEMTATQQRGLDNTPSEDIILKLTDLCLFLEDVRSLIGPLHVNSGYRSVAVNTAVGGQPTSQHCKGEAADLISLSMPLNQFIDTLITSNLPYDQTILEYNMWVHISFTKDREPRRQALMIGSWTDHKYLPYDKAKLP